jgi:flagellar motility protein MotE (MotC chaperone)
MKRRLLILLAALALALPAYSVRDGDAAPVKGKPSASSPENIEGTSVEERRLRSSLQEDTDRLRKREEDLRLRELELKTLEAQVDKKLAEMKRLREEINASLARKKEGQSEKVRELGQMYEKMDPTQAAQLLSAIDEKLAIDILSVMKKKVSGRMLGNMNKEKAARITEAYPALAR